MQHVYVTAHGSWHTGPWVGEAAQFGIRLCVSRVIGAPDMGTVFTPEVNGDVVRDQGTAAGTHGTLARTFSCRIGPVGSELNWDAAYQIDVAEDVWTFLNAVNNYVSAAFRWTHVKQAAVSAAGDTLEHSSIYTFTTPLVGTGVGTLPPQLAMAVSLRANLIGRRGRGRLYFPALHTSAIATDGTVITTVATSLRTNLKTLVDNLQDPPGAPDYIPIVSILSPGQATAVRPEQVRTGNRFDTIQSRRRQVPESYTALAL